MEYGALFHAIFIVIMLVIVLYLEWGIFKATRRIAYLEDKVEFLDKKLHKMEREMY